MESAAKIKETLQAASTEKLPEFIAEYETDPRSGVQKLVASARKKLDALEKRKTTYRKSKKIRERICTVFLYLRDRRSGKRTFGGTGGGRCGDIAQGLPYFVY